MQPVCYRLPQYQLPLLSVCQNDLCRNWGGAAATFRPGFFETEAVCFDEVEERRCSFYAPMERNAFPDMTADSYLLAAQPNL
jgi:hypothetical protein